MPRLSRAYFPNPERPYAGQHYVYYIFTRDAQLGIMPYCTSGEYPFTVTLSKKNKSLEEQLVEFLNVGRYSRWSLDKSLWGAIDTLSHYLVNFGETYLEIVDKDDENKTGIADKKLEFLPLGKVIKLFGNYIQVVPARNWEHGERKFYVIPSDKIWHLSLPRKLGTPRQHRNMLKRLKVLSGSMPDFALMDGALGGSAKYDFKVHHQNKDIAVEHTTAGWGSIRSLGRIKGTTEYYYIANILQSAYSRALLREHILSEINNLLCTLGIKNSIRIEGIVSSTEIEETIVQLEQGEIGFTEALKAIKD